MDSAATMLDNMKAFRKQELRAEFQLQLASGEARHAVLPWSLITGPLVPALYLAFPHRNRPWLYQLRWALVAICFAIDLSQIRNASSFNMFGAYVVGLSTTGGTMWNIALLLCMRPQFEAERVARRKKKEKKETETANGGSGAVAVNGKAPGESSSRQVIVAPDTSVARSLASGYEYYWQAYPENGSIWERLSWTFDVSQAWRGTGWNFAITAIPHFKRPEKSLSGELVALDSIPLSSPSSGTSRCPTYASFLLHKLILIAIGYMGLDICMIIMSKDPYFVFGPEIAASYPVPAHLAGWHPHIIWAYHDIVVFTGMIAGLLAVFTLDQVVRQGIQTILGRPLSSELWQYSDVFGSPLKILDRGLAGFWGEFWHQSFRIFFTAPAVALANAGMLGDPRGNLARAAVTFCAFLFSGTLHTIGSLTTVAGRAGHTRPELVMGFFLLSWVGIMVQTVLCHAPWGLKRYRSSLPRWLRRLGNLVFVTVWLRATAFMLTDDMARCGLWTFEPIPFSFLRWAGYGQPGDVTPWRWEGEYMAPMRVSGKTWFETGWAM